MIVLALNPNPRFWQSVSPLYASALRLLERQPALRLDSAPTITTPQQLSAELQLSAAVPTHLSNYSRFHFILCFFEAQAAAVKMSTQQQAMILDTILALKRTLKRKAYG